MKKYLFLSLLAVLAFASCTNEEVINQELPNKYEKRISVVAEDLTPAEGTRTSYTDNGNGYSFAWSEGDALGIFPTSGHQTDFPIGEGVGSNTAVFDGGKWALRPNESYAAYYPLIEDFKLDPTAIPVSYTGQVQNGNGSTAHLGKYDYMASTFTEVDAKGNVNFCLQHLGCLVQFKLTMPDADTYTALEITSDKTPFITSAKYSLSDNAHAFYDVQTSQTVTIGLSNVSTTAEDKTLTITAMFAPVDLSDSQLTLTVIGNIGKYSAKIDGQKLSQGNYVNSSSTAEGGLDENGNVVFEDPAFKAYMVDNFDTNGDGEISVGEAEAVTVIECRGEWDYVNNCYLGTITNLKGIEYCKNLTVLYCTGNHLTELDMSYNKALSTIDCTRNPLACLNVSNNTALTALLCEYTQLTTLDVSNNNVLEMLYCAGNHLTELDVSNNIALTNLGCSSNELTELDVSNNAALVELFCEYNHLSTLEISNNVALIELWCSHNELTSLDVSNNIALAKLQCTFNKLTELDLSKNTMLTWLNCNFNQLTSLDVRNNTALTELCCGSNQLTSLDVSNNTALTELWCYTNHLATLDVSNNTALTILSCSENYLTSLDVSRNIVLIHLGCGENHLTELDVSKNTALEYLHCSINDLTELDVSNNTALTALYCQSPYLTTIFISECQTINTLYIDDNTELVVKQ